MKIYSDITSLEKLGLRGKEFTTNKKGEVIEYKTKRVVYQPESKEEAKKLRDYTGRRMVVQGVGDVIKLQEKETKEKLKEWREEIKNPRIFVLKGVTDNEGKERKDLDTLPYLPLAISDRYKVPIVIIKDNITKRVDHLAIFGGMVAINQRGEVYDYARVRETAGYCEVLKGQMAAKEARTYYKTIKIDHTTRETKKQVRQIIIDRPMVLEMQVQTGTEIRTLWVTEYQETKDKIIFRQVIEGEVQKRDMAIPKGVLLGIQVKGLM